MAHYLLLDPTNFDPQSLNTSFIKQQQQRAPDSMATIDNPAIPAIIAQQLRLQPCSPNSTLWKESHEWATRTLPDNFRYCVSGWLEGDLTINHLAASLKLNLVHPLPNGRRALLRLYDPRVLQHLHVLLSEAQLAALISPIKRWTYSDWNGDLQTIDIKEPRRHVNLTEAQWASIQRFDATSYVVRVWQTMRAELQRKVPHDASLKADRQVENAQRYGIKSQMDVMAYALYGLEHQEDFDQIPEVQRMLRQCQQGTPFMYFIDSIQQRFLI